MGHRAHFIARVVKKPKLNTARILFGIRLRRHRICFESPFVVILFSIGFLLSDSDRFLTSSLASSVEKGKLPRRLKPFCCSFSS